MIYVQDNYIVQPGKLAAFNELAKEVVTFAKGTGIKVIGSWWTTVGNLNELTTIYASEETGQWEKGLAKLIQNKKFVALVDKAVAMMVSWNRKMMVATSASPLK
jgi:hypothetical protein